MLRVAIPLPLVGELWKSLVPGCTEEWAGHNSVQSVDLSMNRVKSHHRQSGKSVLDNLWLLETAGEYRCWTLTRLLAWISNTVILFLDWAWGGTGKRVIPDTWGTTITRSLLCRNFIVVFNLYFLFRGWYFISAIWSFCSPLTGRRRWIEGASLSPFLFFEFSCLDLYLLTY